MGARDKLNSAYTTGCLAMASLIGLACESWAMFFVALVVLIGVAVNNGDIRPGK